MGFTKEDVRAYLPVVQNLFLGAKPGKNAQIARLLVPEVKHEFGGQLFDIAPEDMLRLFDDTTDDGIAELYDFDPELLKFEQRIRALKVNLSRRSRQAAQGPLKNIMNMAQSGMRLALDLKYEQRVAAALNDTATFASTAATQPIGTPGDAPVDDLIQAGEEVRLNLGHYPNKVVYSGDVWSRAAQSKALQEFVNTFRTNGTTGGVLTAGLLESALSVAWGQENVKVLVGAAVGNAAPKGAPKNMIDLWQSGRVLVGYFEDDLPQFRTDRTDNLPVGAPGEVLEGLTTPLVSIMGPDHGNARQWEGEESGDQFLRFEYDYTQRTATEEALHIITGS